MLSKGPHNRPVVSSSGRSIGPEQFPKLESIRKGKFGPKNLAPCLRSLVLNPRSRVAFFKKLDSFLPRKTPSTNGRPIPEPANEFPDRLYAALYDALSPCLNCNCPAAKGFPERSRVHRSNLKLLRDQLVQDDDLIIDTVIQASKPHHNESQGHWNFIRFLIPKMVSRNGEGSARDHPGSPMCSSDFCSLLVLARGPYCRQIRVVCDELINMKRPILAEQKLAAQESVSLANALRSSSLSDDGKLLLAHGIAHSVWRFYGTKLMCNRWTAEQIQFMVENSMPISTNPIHPYVPLYFGQAPEFTSTVEGEFLPDEELVHWAPRIFSLGVVLALILGDALLPDPDHEAPWQEKYNNDAFDYRQIVAGPYWPHLEIKSTFVRTTLKEAVGVCLNGEVFNHRMATVAERKALLYNKVVWPLEYVVKIAGSELNNAVWTARLSTIKSQAVEEQQCTGEALLHKTR